MTFAVHTEEDIGGASNYSIETQEKEELTDNSLAVIGNDDVFDQVGRQTVLKKMQVTSIGEM